MKRWQQYHRAPRALRKATLDNIALVPASLLPYKAQYQAIANALPRGDVLIILPQANAKERHLLQQTAARFQAKGHQVTMLQADDLACRIPLAPRSRP